MIFWVVHWHPHLTGTHVNTNPHICKHTSEMVGVERESWVGMGIQVSATQWLWQQRLEDSWALLVVSLIPESLRDRFIHSTKCYETAQVRPWQVSPQWVRDKQGRADRT